MKRTVRYFSVTVLLLVAPLLAGQQGIGNPAPYRTGIRYEVSLARRAAHLLHVTMHVTPGPDLQVQLPVWNGLYQVRDFAQYVPAVSARDAAGNSVTVRKLDKSTWSAPNAAMIDYDVSADEPGPFGAQINDDHAFLNLAEVLMYVVGQTTKQPVVVVFSGLPAGWRMATSMRAPGLDSAPMSCAAEDYDRMVDSPVELGTFHQFDFDEGGAKYRVVVDADPADYDAAAITDMARKLAATEVEWMQDRPFDQYLFIYHFPRGPAGGGMEHAYSTAIDASAERVKNDPGSLASVTAHEMFHLWNVKRIRPQSLEPVDYTREQYTRALWFSEGVTSTVTDYMRVRAGLLDEQRYLAELAAAITRLEARPARLTQSVEEASLDTWLDKYSYYDQPGRSISYYNKGEIVGVLLDLAMREASGGKASLRDLFQWMNRHYAAQGRFFPDTAGVEAAAEAVSGADFRDFFLKYVAGTDPLPYDRFFAGVGLRLKKERKTVPVLGFRTKRNSAQGAVITSVQAGSEAERAGVRVGELVQQFNGKLVTGGLDSLLPGLRVGETVRLKLATASGTREVKFKISGSEQDEYAFMDIPGATGAQRARRAAWLRGESQP